MATLIKLTDSQGMKFAFVLENVKRFQEDDNNDLVVVQNDNETITLELDYDEGIKIIEKQLNRL